MKTKHLRWIQNNRFEIRSRTELSVVPLSKEAPLAPFRVRETHGGYELTCSTAARLSIKLNNRIIVDTGACQILPISELIVRANFAEQIVVSDGQGQRWKVGFRGETHRLPFWDPSEWMAMLRPLTKSSVTHLLLASITIFVMTHQSQLLSLEEFLLNARARAQLNLGSSTIQAERPTPFGGVGMREYQALLQAEANAASPTVIAARTTSKTGNMLSSLFKGFKSKIGEEAGIPAPPTRGAIDTRSLVGDALKNQQTQAAPLIAQKLPNHRTAPPSILAAAPAGKHQEIVLRQKLESIKPSLSRAYDEALQIDPRLDVTLAYEGTIDSSGRLAGLTIDFRGHAPSVALASLERRVRSAFDELEVGAEFSGLNLKGEQAFVR